MLRTISILFMLAALTSSAQAQYLFSKIVESGDPRPNAQGGPSGTFSNRLRSTAPGLGDGVVAFQDTEVEALYINLSGTITAFVDDSVVIPGAGGTTFDEFNDVIPVSNGNLVFLHRDETSSTDENEGFFLFADGSLSRLATGSDSAPGGTGTFNSFRSDPITTVNADFAFDSIDENSVAGVYSVVNGVISLIVDETSMVPGTTNNFGSFDEPQRQADGDVVFEATSAGVFITGIYGWIDGELVLIANETTPVPDGAGTFTSGQDPFINDGDIVFVGRDANSIAGIYGMVDGGPLTALVDENTPVPGGIGTFNDFSNDSLKIEGGLLSFQGRFNHANQSGLYVQRGEGLIKLIATGDTLDGRLVSSITHEKQGRDGRSFAFSVEFEDGSAAIYLAEPDPRFEPSEPVPTQSPWSLLLLTLLFFLMAIYSLLRLPR